MDDNIISEDLTKDALYFIRLFAGPINKCAEEFMRHFPEKALSYKDSKIGHLLTEASGHMNQIRDMLNSFDFKGYEFDKLPDRTKKEIEARMVDITNFLIMVWTKVK